MHTLIIIPKSPQEVLLAKLVGGFRGVGRFIIKVVANQHIARSASAAFAKTLIIMLE